LVIAWRKTFWTRGVAREFPARRTASRQSDLL